MVGGQRFATWRGSWPEQCAIPAVALMPFGVGLMAWVLPDRPDLLEVTIAARPGAGVGVLRRPRTVGGAHCTTPASP